MCPEKLDQIVWQYSSCHAHGDTFGPVRKQYGNLGRKNQRFGVSTVVGRRVFGEFRVEQHFLGKGAQSALYVPCGGRHVAREDVAEVPLFVDANIFVGEND